MKSNSFCLNVDENHQLERLSTTFNGKRQLAVDSLYFFSNLKKSIRKIENNSHVPDKRETTHFDVEIACECRRISGSSFSTGQLEPEIRLRSQANVETAKFGVLPFGGKINVMLLKSLYLLDSKQNILYDIFGDFI